MKEFIRQKNSFISDKSTFCTPFYGDLDEQLFRQCKTQIFEYTTSQKRIFIALARASMSGKTRLLFELSLKHPLILCSFKNVQDGIYVSLLKSVSLRKDNSIIESSY